MQEEHRLRSSLEIQSGLICDDMNFKSRQCVSDGIIFVYQEPNIQGELILAFRLVDLPVKVFLRGRQLFERLVKKHIRNDEWLRKYPRAHDQKMI